MAINDKALAGRVALVTGASRGIGRAIAIALGRRGAKVIVNYASREDAAREVVAAVEAVGGQAAIAGFDVAQSSAVTDAIKAIGKEHGSLDILVNNAGVAVNGLLMRFSDEQWQKTLNTNLAGAFHTTRAAATFLLKAKEHGRIINITSVVGEMGNGGQAAYAASKAGLIGLTMATAKERGRVVNITSVVGEMGNGGQAAYAAAKAAIIGFTKSMAKEVASRGVTVNAVSPGYIDTDMTSAHLPEAQKTLLMAQIPTGRIGSADDVAGPVAFLCGPEAAYITGAVLRVNGGLLM